MFERLNHFVSFIFDQLSSVLLLLKRQVKHFYILHLILDTFYIYQKIKNLTSSFIHSYFFLPNNGIKFFMTYFDVISAWDTKVSMLSSLLSSNIRILSCFFFLFLVVLINFLIIPVAREKIKVRLTIPAGAPTTLAGEMIQTPLLVVLKTIEILSM